MNLSPLFKELDCFCRKLKREGKIISMVNTHAFVRVNLLNKSLKIITLIMISVELQIIYGDNPKYPCGICQQKLIKLTKL